MYPELFHLGPLTVYSYGVLLATAYLLGLRLAMSRARARGLDPTTMLDLGIYIIISALVGGWSIVQTTRKGPRDWRLVLQWVSWAIAVAVAFGSVSYDSKELAKEEKGKKRDR